MTLSPRLVAAPILAIGALAATATAMAQQGPKPEQLIKWRQSTYQVIAWNTGRIKANVDGQFNKEEVVKAANVIAALANANLGQLYAPGTATGRLGLVEFRAFEVRRVEPHRDGLLAQRPGHARLRRLCQPATVERTGPPRRCSGSPCSPACWPTPASIPPGEITLTRMPCGWASTASDLVNPITPCLAAV